MVGPQEGEGSRPRVRILLGLVALVRTDLPSFLEKWWFIFQQNYTAALSG